MAKRRKPIVLLDPQESARKTALALLRLRTELREEAERQRLGERAYRERQRPGTAARNADARRRLIEFGPDALAMIAGDAQEKARRILHEIHADVGPPQRVDDADREDRAGEVVRGRGGRLKPAFWEVLGDPPECAPGDLDAARSFYRRVVLVQERGGWTRVEQATLITLARIWGARARGEDVRFMIVGNRKGRLARDVERQIRARIEQQRQQQGDRHG